MQRDKLAVMESDRGAAIGRRARQAREEIGLSQEAVGQRIGLSKVGYGEYERGRRSLTVEQLFMLERALHRPVIWLLGIDTELSLDEQQVLALYRRAKEMQRADIAADILQALTKGN